MDDRLRPCKHISLEFPSPSLWGSAPELASNQTVIQHVFLVVNSFLQLDFMIAMIHISTIQICILGSVVRALLFTSERLPVLIQTVCFCSSGKGASIPLNLLNPNHHFPSAIIDCLREAKSFLHIDCSNESSFAKTIQLFTIADTGPFEMRFQNG